MVIRENYLKKMIDAKDTDFIKVVTGVRRSGKSTLLLMFRDYLPRLRAIFRSISSNEVRISGISSVMTTVCSK